MAPPPPLPELNDDVLAEILLRLPPEEPWCLFRASLVCKLWRRLITDAAFLRRYRRFHRTLPLLGFRVLAEDEHDGQVVSRFIPTTSPSPFPKPMLNSHPWSILDCRHGLVLLLLQESVVDRFFVWDPITCGRRELDPPCIPLAWHFALLCGVPGCDHRDCRGGPFVVVSARDDFDGTERAAHASVYSSQMGSWGMPVSVPIGVGDYVNSAPGALAGDGIYFMLGMGARILKYDLSKHHLSVIDPPESYLRGIFIVPTEDCLLGVAGIKGTSLYLWSRMVNAVGVEGWMQYRVIELQILFPDDNFLYGARVIGFAEGVRVIFLDTSHGISIIDLNSEQARTVSGPGAYGFAVPFMSFYTPDCACGKLPLPAETN